MRPPPEFGGHAQPRVTRGDASPPDSDVAQQPAGWRARAARVVEERGVSLRLGIYSGLILTVGLIAYHLYRSVPPTINLDEPVPVVLMAEPSDCEVFLDGKLLGRTDSGRLTVELDPANTDVRWLEVRKAGYEPARRALSAYLGLPGMQLKLRRRPFEALVSSIPTGAEIWIDNELRGFSPLVIKCLPDGDKPIRVVARQPGYEPVDTELHPPATDQTTRLDLTMRALPPQLSVTTDPPGAEIAVDGKVVGVSPITATLDDASRGKTVVVRAALDKHDPVERKLEVPRAAGPALNADLKLNGAATALNIETDPPGAEIKLNGESKGLSPLTVKLPDDQLAGALQIEALVPGAWFGKLTLNDVERSSTRTVRVPMAMFSRTVVFAIDCAALKAEHFELRRENIKQKIHNLPRERQFAVIALSGGRTFIGPEPRPTQASSEQKVRAYDRMDGLRWGGAGSEAIALVNAAASLKPDSIWLYTASPVIRSEWLIAFEPFGDNPPAVQLMVDSQDQVEPWMSEWLAAHRGSVRVVAEDRPEATQSADAR